MFKKFCSERDRQVSAEDILKDWEKAKKRLGRISNEMYVECVAKLGEWIKKTQLKPEQAIELARFMHDAPSEPRVATWSVLQKNTKNLLMVHPHVEQLMVRTTTGQDTSTLRVAAPAPGGSTSAAGGLVSSQVPPPRQRGARR